MCRRALILPDGMRSLVSIEEVIASESSMLTKGDLDDVSLFSKASCIISFAGVNECVDSSLTNDAVNHFKAIHQDMKIF